MFKPTPEQFFANRGQDRTKPDIAFLKNHFYREGRLTEEQALWILEQGTELLRKEFNVLEVDAPITGMYLTIFSICTEHLCDGLASMRRHTRSICQFSAFHHTDRDPDIVIPVRPNETVRSRWQSRRYQVSLPRRLCRQRLFQH